MIILAHGHERTAHDSLFDQMFRLRAQAFSDRRKWSVNVVDGREIDRFDALNPLYVMSVDEDGTLLASLRLLQTTGPHMLADVFPEVMAGGTVIRHPLIWESTRFCVDTAAIARHSHSGVNAVTGELLTGLFETAHSIGLINIVSVYDLFLERILRRAGCLFDRLGEPFAYDGLKTVAGVFEVSERAVDSIRSHSEVTGSIFAAQPTAHVETKLQGQTNG